jgi:hypothetical protein
MMTRCKLGLAVPASAVMAPSFAAYAYASAASVTVVDRKISRGEVTIADVNLPSNGFVVMHPSGAKSQSQPVLSSEENRP